jgi:hypothetical protein
MEHLHLEPGQPAGGPDPVFIARQLAGILADHHELQARTYRLMQLSLTTSAVAITAAAADPVTLPPLPKTGELAERVQQLLERLDALPKAVAGAGAKFTAAAPPQPDPQPAAPADAAPILPDPAPPALPPLPAEPAPAPMDPAPAPIPADPPPASPPQVMAEAVAPIVSGSPPAPPRSEPALPPVVAGTPDVPRVSAHQRVCAAWAASLDGPAAIARHLDMPVASVTARLAQARSRQDPQVVTGDAARRAAGQQLKAKAPLVAADPAATRRDRVLDSYRRDPAKLVVLSARLNVPVPDLSGILLAARQAKDPRVLDGDAKMREANEAARGRPSPLNPVQIKARAELRNRVLDHYADTGDHPSVTARKLDTTRALVEEFIEDAGKSDERVRLGNIRRAKQVRAGK